MNDFSRGVTGRGDEARADDGQATADTYMHLDREDLKEAMKLADIRWQELAAEEGAD